MSKRWTIAFTVLLLACGEGDQGVPEKPENLLERDKMIDVMLDAQMAESYIRNGRHNIDSIVPGAFYDDVWKKHDITSEDLEESLKYYSLFPDTLEQFYEEIINRLTERQAEIESEMEANNEG